MLFIKEFLFRVDLWKGIKVDVPDGLIEVLFDDVSWIGETYKLTLNRESELVFWLEHECEGLWKMKLNYFSKENKKSYIAFDRLTDAMIFRLKIP